MSNVGVFTKKLDRSAFKEKIQDILTGYGCEIEDDEIEDNISDGELEIELEAGETFDSDALQVFAMLVAGYIMFQNGFGNVVPEMMETFLVHVVVTPPIEDDVDDEDDMEERCDLFTYVHEKDDELFGIETRHLEFTDLEDENEFFKKSLFNLEEWEIILGFLILLFQNPAKCKSHTFMTFALQHADF